MVTTYANGSSVHACPGVTRYAVLKRETEFFARSFYATGEESQVWARGSRLKRDEDDNDSYGLPTQDHGVERAIDEGVAWLCRAQDHSASCDGGLVHHYFFITYSESA